MSCACHPNTRSCTYGTQAIFNPPQSEPSHSDLPMSDPPPLVAAPPAEHERLPQFEPSDSAPQAASKVLQLYLPSLFSSRNPSILPRSLHTAARKYLAAPEVRERFLSVQLPHTVQQDMTNCSNRQP